jgi:NIPSNAP
LFIEQRTYTFRPGTVQPWLKKYEAEGLPIQKRHLGRFLGIFTTEIGNIHQIVMFWAWDGLDDRDRRRAAMNADPAWQAYIEEIWAMNAIKAQEVRILRPTSFSPSLI